MGHPKRAQRYDYRGKHLLADLDEAADVEETLGPAVITSVASSPINTTPTTPPTKCTPEAGDDLDDRAAGVVQHSGPRKRSAEHRRAPQLDLMKF